MIHSMTGYGKAVIKAKHGVVTVEIKTLNHKFFEVSAKVPNGFASYEDKLKSIIHKKVRRGKVYLNVEVNGRKESLPRVTIDRKTAAAYNREFLKLKRSLGLKGEIRLDQLILLPGVIVKEAATADARNIMPYLEKALHKALGELDGDRAKEGRTLYRDLLKRTRNIRDIVEDIEERSTLSIVKYKNNLSKRIRELMGTGSFDKGRFEQEVALFAKNSDISEELTRLKSHLATFKESLSKDTEIGKKLDFIAQELHREANTIASKSSDYKISKEVIQIKSDIEKIREQVKNVE